MLASRIHDWVGPREKAGPKPMVSSPAAWATAARAARDAILAAAIFFISFFGTGRERRTRLGLWADVLYREASIYKCSKVNDCRRAGHWERNEFG